MESGKFRYSADELKTLRAALLAGPGTIDRDDADSILRALEMRANGYIADVKESAALPDRKYLEGRAEAKKRQINGLIAELETVDLLGDADLIGLADLGVFVPFEMLRDEKIGLREFEAIIALRYLRSKRAYPLIGELAVKEKPQERGHRRYLIEGALYYWCDVHGVARGNLTISGSSAGPGGILMNFLEAACGPPLKRTGQMIDRDNFRPIVRAIKADAQSLL